MNSNKFGTIYASNSLRTFINIFYKDKQLKKHSIIASKYWSAPITIVNHVAALINIQMIVNGRNMPRSTDTLKHISFILELAIVIYQIISIRLNALFLLNLWNSLELIKKKKMKKKDKRRIKKAKTRSKIYLPNLRKWPWIKIIS